MLIFTIKQRKTEKARNINSSHVQTTNINITKHGCVVFEKGVVEGVGSSERRDWCRSGLQVFEPYGLGVERLTY